MTDNHAKVLVLGATMVDIVCYVDRLPKSGEGIVPRSVTKTVGGCALNSAAALNYLGVKPILFAPVGKGLFSTMAKQAISSLGLAAFEQVGFSESPYDCGACICLVEPDGERTMITIPGIERHFSASWFTTLSKEALSTLRAAIVCGYELETPGGDDILTFLEAHSKLQVFYAPGPRVCAVPPKRVDRLRALRAIWHLNDQEICSYTGESDFVNAGRKLAQEIDAPVIVTAGDQGSYAFVPYGESAAERVEGCIEGHAERSGEGHIGENAEGHTGAYRDEGFDRDFDGKFAAIKVISVPSTPVIPVNTVGAGDTHLGAVVASWVNGADWQKALICANNAAANVCLIEGAALTR